MGVVRIVVEQIVVGTIVVLVVGKIVVEVVKPVVEFVKPVVEVVVFEVLDFGFVVEIIVVEFVNAMWSRTWYPSWHLERLLHLN